MIPIRVWDQQNHRMHYLSDDPEALTVTISDDSWFLDHEHYGLVTDYNSGALMLGTDQFDTGDRELTKGDRIYANDIVLQEEQAPGNPTGILKIIGIVKMLDGAWVIDTGSEAVPLFSETATNTILGDVFTTPYLTEALGCERQQKYS
ncbi:hypothetical protein BSP10_097 [Bacillus phage BSP10]|uniref:YopX family protein n=1 Tax=Bacillus phage SPG24 TaxID=1497851 RepID=UPI000CA3D545|nr:YopX family protein [Bacillus phage SPG24]ATN94432.1 hypothetical protein BSP9_083 [Bacillus phage BSP9]AUO79500.1 hypothetical protein BSP10_097 [Bacillus phage BSP10]QRI44668.1 hypothetical protein BSTP3_122 [Bacillus phage BSTP3]